MSKEEEKEGRRRNPQRRDPGDELAEERVSGFVFACLPRPW